MVFQLDATKQAKIHGLVTITKTLLANQTLTEMRLYQVKVNLKEISRKLLELFAKEN